MNSPGRSIHGPRLVIGLFVVLLGALFLLDNFGLFYMDEVWRYWPVVLIAVGLARLLQSEGRRGSSLVITAVGVLMLFHNLRLFDFDVWELWPAFLVLLGLSMVWGALSGRQGGRSGGGARFGGNRLGGALSSHTLGDSGGPSAEVASGFSAPSAGASGATAGAASGVTLDAGSWIKAAAILGSSSRGSNSRDFRGGDATAVLGGCELNLRQATIAGNEAVIDVFAFWGGIDIRVPEDWSVVVHATPLLGGVSDQTRRPAVPGKQLVVKGLVVMGGVDIQN